jgi:hypothetical protein
LAENFTGNGGDALLNRTTAKNLLLRIRVLRLLLLIQISGEL